MFSNPLTSIFGIAVLVLKIVGIIKPALAPMFAEIEDALLGGGLIAAADSSKSKTGPVLRSVLWAVGLVFLGLAVLGFAGPALAFDVTITGTEIGFSYTEPSSNKDGSKLADLAETRVYFQWEGGSPAIGATVPASGPGGGGAVSGTLTVPVLQDEEANVLFWATARDASGNESAPSQTQSQRIDRLAPGSPR